MNNFIRYCEAIDFLESLSNLPMEKEYMRDHSHPSVYIKRMRYFLNLIGNPDKNFKIIHITGTAGKGTVTTMVHEILYASGKRVGSFTSPFVTTSIEKIKVGNVFIAPDELADIVDYLKPFINRAYLESPYGKPSYFEIFLAIAFVYFKRQKCEWIVLEVGAGGRYDATNVVEKPLITAITNIDYDHTELLGNTLREIAYDKAGIIKRGSIFFTTEQRPALIKIFLKVCNEQKVQMCQLPKQNNYQEDNKSLATAIAKKVGMTEKNIAMGIENTHLQCRFETMQKKPAVIIDGAHNRSKVKSTLANLKGQKFSKLHVIMAIADSKNHDQILKQIIPLADYLYITRFQVKERKCAHPKELFEKSEKYLKKESKAELFLDPNLALAKALKTAHKSDLILVVGSFFLAGEMRKHWVPEIEILQTRNLQSIQKVVELDKSMILLDGKKLRDLTAEALKTEIAGFVAQGEAVPTLAILQIGELAESDAYIKQKKLFADKIGAQVLHKKYPLKVSEETLIADIKKMNVDKAVHGIILQLPISDGLDKQKIIDEIKPEKDVDGLTATNVKRLWANDNRTIVPATVQGVISLLQHYEIPIDSQKVVIVGRSTLVGKPLALALLNQNATVTLCHRHTKNLAHETREADILIVAVGSVNLITKEHVKAGQVIVDVGINMIGEKNNKKNATTLKPENEIAKKVMVGDVDFEAVKDIVSAISPVPGGIGPMTVASLFQNLIHSYRILLDL